MMTQKRTRKRDAAIFFPAIGAQLISTTSLYILPILMGALERGGLSERKAGLLLSIELPASALATLCVSTWVPSHLVRHGALLGGLLAIVGTALTLITPAFPVLTAVRLVAGIGAGIAAAEAATVVARGIDRQRLVANLTIVSIVHASFWLAVLPYTIDKLGYRGPYACLLLICLAGTLLLTRLPSVPVWRHASSATGRPRWPLVGLLVVPAVFLTQLGQGTFWSLEETFGSRAGLTDHVIGLFLSMATLFLLVGAVGAAWVGVRFGRFAPLLTLIAINALSILVVSAVPIPQVFVAANAVQSVTNLASVIYQLGLAADLDRSGRIISASMGAVTLGNGLGPGFSANLNASFGASSVGIFVLALNGLAFASYCLVRLDRSGLEVVENPRP
jgi:predicted MFS family arabinose efflux permease